MVTVQAVPAPITIVSAATPGEQEGGLHERRRDHVASEMGPEIASIPERQDDEAEQRGDCQRRRGDRD